VIGSPGIGHAKTGGSRDPRDQADGDAGVFAVIRSESQSCDAALPVVTDGREGLEIRHEAIKIHGGYGPSRRLLALLRVVVSATISHKLHACQSHSRKEDVLHPNRDRASVDELVQPVLVLPLRDGETYRGQPYCK